VTEHEYVRVAVADDDQVDGVTLRR
jgi:hypothetical protein